ncbi:MAG: HEAT repeat domain-containing protein [Bacteroidota bacterium]
MKTRRVNLVKAAGLILAVITFIANTAIAQEATQNTFSKRAIDNLNAGIMSENSGLRKSSIYFAGKYRVTESVDVLVTQLNKIEDPGTKVLIALSLYLIGEQKGLDAVYSLAKTDNDSHVRRMCNAIYAEYIKVDGDKYTSADFRK